MIIKESEYKVCKECKHTKLIKDEEYGCDTCGTNIKFLDSGDDVEYLDITVHHQNDNTNRLHFCSWACVFEKLRTIKTDYFISLPFLMFNTNVKSLGVEGFWAAIKCLSQ